MICYETFCSSEGEGGMNIQAAISEVIDGHSLSTDQMVAVMQQIMTGECSDAQIAGFLVALRMKGETVDEITGAAKVMRKLATGVAVSGPHLVDIVGTGGDGIGTFNISTASTFVVAAAGGQVAKHGNRSVSSKSGAADLLEAAGVRLDLTAEEVARCVDTVGVGFMFALNHHSAMKHAIGPRKELATRTIFNLLGPITNPAGVPNQLLGVYSRQWVRPIAEVLRDLGSDHVLVVHSADGLDEISIADKTYVAELRDGNIKEYTIEPEQFGMNRASLDQLKVESAEQSLAVIKKLLAGAESPAADIVALNAGAAIYVANIASSLEQGVVMAQDILASGTASEKLKELALTTQTMKSL
ncbi:Anthranilate phosphoribosyltransferase [marine gamma proteobacterium HTCC2143]|uniref:Anthranilate phosphoribosyltransferase n=1 Tax=marine gamma proteobacterium HTCC2143 TaxID=247633 RepID=A0Y825_9GAMM|nr:Anthranilate phosphoribosyltransferase [marine gamma proteobacterium HTCC2143]